MNAIKFSQASTFVSVRLKTNVLETSSVSSTLMMETELVSETLVFNLTLMYLISQENFMALFHDVWSLNFGLKKIMHFN
jgi:hypothetical protein